MRKTIPIADAKQLLEKTMEEHYGSSYPCEICGTHTNCGGRDEDCRGEDSWSIYHVVNKFSQAIEEKYS